MNPSKNKWLNHLSFTDENFTEAFEFLQGCKPGFIFTGNWGKAGYGEQHVKSIGHPQ